MNVVHLLEYKKGKEKIKLLHRIGIYILQCCFFLIGTAVLLFLIAEWWGLLFYNK